VFPHLRPSKNVALPWTNTQLTVERAIIGKDPSVQGSGVHGNITGARIDDLILDDILDYENTRTKHARDELMRWILNTLIGRLTNEACVWVIGNSWHPEDAMHELAKMPRFSAYRFPVVLTRRWRYRSGSSALHRSQCAQVGVTQKSSARAFDVERINDVRHLQARCPRVWVWKNLMTHLHGRSTSSQPSRGGWMYGG
jgi:hypothetical protein